MKTPRVKDFDPNAKAPTLKSSLERMPAIEKLKPSTSTEMLQDQANQSIPERSNDRTPVRPNGRRIISRHSFEVYDDQIDSLRNLSYQEKMEGKLGSMSQMVREAIDNYLKERSSAKR